MQAATPGTLQEAQTEALLTLLNLNVPPTAAPNPITNPGATKGGAGLASAGTSSGPPVWKVLVLDQRTQDVLATVLRVQDLRDVGVTLHVYGPSIVDSVSI
jgi:sec1 family domain-containing protein 1